jgi:hypothetical protein
VLKRLGELNAEIAQHERNLRDGDSCEKCLLYFGQVLRDLGVDNTIELREDAVPVLDLNTLAPPVSDRIEPAL